METEYKTFFPKASPDLKFKTDFKYEIITDLSRLEEVCNVEGKNVRQDLRYCT